MIHVINTGGTFNKVYNRVVGELVVPVSNDAIEEIVKSFYDNLDILISGVIYKDSLDMDDNDREELAKEIEKSKSDKIIVVHGTDTMVDSARYVAKKIKDRCIVFTGAMVPFSIDKVEATSNFNLALAKLLLKPQNGVFIAMHSFVLPYDEIVKDKRLGKFVEV